MREIKERPAGPIRQSLECTHLSDCNWPFVHHPRAAPRPPLFAIFAGLAMMLSPKVGGLSPKVGVSTQALAQPAVGVLCRRRAPRERRLGARKGACWTSVVGARESPFPTLFCPLAQIRLDSTCFCCAVCSERLNLVTPRHGQPKTPGRLHSCLNAELQQRSGVPDFLTVFPGCLQRCVLVALATHQHQDCHPAPSELHM